MDTVLPEDRPSGTAAGSASGRTAIVVVGMHRSGTSAMASFLEKLGVMFGDRLAEAAPDNVRGFWEHKEIVSLHNKLLRALGSNWDDERPLPADWLQNREVRTIKAALAAVVQRDFRNTPVFGLKDPRLSLLVPLWTGIFRDLGIAARFLLMLRHPAEVAASLAERNAFSPAQSYLLWLRYTIDAEMQTRNEMRAIVTFDRLLEQPRQVLDSIRKTLQIALPIGGSEEQEALKQLPPSLRHHRRDGDMAASASIPDIIYSALEAGDLQRFDAVVAEFRHYANLFQPRITELAAALVQTRQTEARLANEVQSMTDLRGRLDEANRAAAQSHNELQQLKAESVSMAAELADARWDVLRQREDLLIRKDATQKAENRITELEIQLHVAAKARDELGEMIEQLENDIERLRSVEQESFMVSDRLAQSENNCAIAQTRLAALRDHLTATNSLLAETRRCLRVVTDALNSNTARDRGRSVGNSKSNATADQSRLVDTVKSISAHLKASVPRKPNERREAGVGGKPAEESPT